MRKSVHILLLCCLMGLSSCDSEKLAKGFFWSFNKVLGDGFLPSSEILLLGEFEGSEVHVSKSTQNGQKENTITLKLHNGRSEALRFNEENTARKCAQLYAEGYSKIREYQTIIIQFVQTDPNNPQNIAMSEYEFQVTDLLE